MTLPAARLLLIFAASMLLSLAARAEDDGLQIDTPSINLGIRADDLLDADSEPLGFVPSLSMGLSGQISGTVDRTGEKSRSVIGPAFFGSLAYNTRYFLRPFVDFGYMSLYSSSLDTPYGPVTASTTAWSLILGPSYRHSGFRARAGIGVTQLRIRSGFAGTQVSTNELDLTEELGASARIYALGSYWIWLEGRTHFILSTGNVVLSLGLTIDYGGWLKTRESRSSP